MTEPIKGYRTLTPEELILINTIKVVTGSELLKALNDVRLHISRQRAAVALINRDAQQAQVFEEAKALREKASAELKRIDDATPERWAAIANTHFQEGLMALVRAVAQPEGF